MTSTLTKYKEYAYEIIYLTGDFKKKLPLFVLMFIILSLLDLAGIGLILPYVALISSPESFFNNDEGICEDAEFALWIAGQIFGWCDESSMFELIDSRVEPSFVFAYRQDNDGGDQDKGENHPVGSCQPVVVV